MSNEKIKLVVLSRSFAKASDEPLRYLDEHGFDIDLIRNSSPQDLEFISKSIGDARAVITGSDVINQFVMDRCPNLEIVSKQGVGLDSIDLPLAKERNITVTNTPNANSEAVADLTLMLILAVYRNLRGVLIQSDTPDWSTHPLSRDLYGKTVGLIGFGGIGSATAKRLEGFSCDILVSDPVVTQADIQSERITVVSMDELLKRSDVVSLHAPLTGQTSRMINREALEKMKDGAVLVNTSRGGLIDEDDVYEAVVSGKLLGVGLDVFSAEPPVGLKLLTLPQVVATPHIAPHTVETNYRMGMAAAKNVVSYFEAK